MRLFGKRKIYKKWKCPAKRFDYEPLEFEPLKPQMQDIADRVHCLLKLADCDERVVIIATPTYESVYFAKCGDLSQKIKGEWK